MELYHAAKRGDIRKVKFLCEQQNATALDVADPSTLWTPLHVAANEGHLDVVQYLVEQGAGKEKRAINGETAMAMAAFNGHLEVIKYLLEQGSSIETRDNDGWTPLNSSVLAGQLEVVRYLLEQGADRDKGNVEGGTPLHHAAHMGNEEILLLLMSYGANLNARSSDGQLPIDLALREEIRQAIRDEPRRRMDHGLKRSTEQDWDAATEDASSVHQNSEEEEPLSVLFEGLTCTKERSTTITEGKQEEDSDDDSETSDEEDN